MDRFMLLICYVIIALVLQGCGLIFSFPEECKYETPYPAARDFFWFGNKDHPKAGNKDDFIKAWGNPDKIITKQENTETWMYQRNLWCGITPVFFLPVPLLLPICDGYDQIEFNGDLAQRLNTRRIVTAGVFIPGGSAEDPVCRYPIPFESPTSISDKVPDDFGLVVLYRTEESTNRTYYYPIYMNETYIAPLYGNSYYSFLAANGEKDFMVGSYNKGSLKLNIKAGEIYYIRIESVRFSPPQLKLVESATANKEVERCNLIKYP